MVIRLLEFLNVCACVHVQMCIWPADEKHTSIPIAELPSNITHGLCFDPLASHSPQPPLKPRAYWTVCGPQGCMHSAPLSLLRSKFTPSCPYSHCQFLLCLFVSVCSAGLITAEQDLAVFPPHSAIRTLWGILLLLLLHSWRLFSKHKTLALTLVLVNPCWESSAGFFLSSHSFSWMMHAFVRWKSYKNRLLAPGQCLTCYQCLALISWDPFKEILMDSWVKFWNKCRFIANGLLKITHILNFVWMWTYIFLGKIHTQSYTYIYLHNLKASVTRWWTICILCNQLSFTWYIWQI